MEKEQRMKITLELLRSKGACSAGMTWVEENLPNGAEYQVFLDALAAADKPDWASWLLANFGRTTDIKTVTAVTAGTKHIFAAGRLVFECSASIPSPASIPPAASEVCEKPKSPVRLVSSRQRIKKNLILSAIGKILFNPSHSI